MARIPKQATRGLHPARVGAPIAAAILALSFALLAPTPTSATSVPRDPLSPTAASWCYDHGSSVGAWVGSTPDMPICGPAPNSGGTWAYVDLPGPYGVMGRYYNATPGFQCVELGERYLAVVDGFAPVLAEGSEVAINYHAAYPTTGLVVNGTAGAVGHPPTAGDVISFSFSPGFYDPTDGHVAVVVDSTVNAAGDGTVDIAQENVPASDYLRTLDLVSWRLSDPESPGDTEYSWPYAEWLVVHPPAAPELQAHLKHSKRAERRISDSPLVFASDPTVVPKLLHRRHR